MGLEKGEIESMIHSEYTRLSSSIDGDSEAWKSDLPGRLILNKFASAAKIPVGRLKQLYLFHADKDVVFSEIIDIFQGFRDGI